MFRHLKNKRTVDTKTAANMAKTPKRLAEDVSQTSAPGGKKLLTDRKSATPSDSDSSDTAPLAKRASRTPKMGLLPVRCVGQEHKGSV